MSQKAAIEKKAKRRARKEGQQAHTVRVSPAWVLFSSAAFITVQGKMKTDDYICGCHYGALQNAVQFLNLASSCGILLNAASLERSVLRPAGAALRRNKIGCFAGCVAAH